MRQKADISDASREDLSVLAEIERQCISGGWSEKAISESMEQSGTVFLKADLNGKTAGFINGRAVCDEAEIMNIAVLPQYRRNGIAQELALKFCRWALEIGAENVYLEVREKNTPAKNLYEKIGFKTCGSRKNYYKEPCDNAVIMVKKLKDGDDI